MRITNFGRNSRTLSINWFASAPLTPKGGFSPIIYSKVKAKRKVKYLSTGTQKAFISNQKKLLTNWDPFGNSFVCTVNQSLCSKLKSFYQKKTSKLKNNIQAWCNCWQMHRKKSKKIFSLDCMQSWLWKYLNTHNEQDSLRVFWYFHNSISCAKTNKN